MNYKIPLILLLTFLFACEQRYRNIVSELEPVLIAELARWGDVRSGDPDALLLDWEKQKQWTLENWFPNRINFMLSELKRYGLVSDTTEIEDPNP